MKTEATAESAPAFLRVLEKRSLITVMLACVALIGVLGWVDLASGYELSFAIFFALGLTLGRNRIWAEPVGAA